MKRNELTVGALALLAVIAPSALAGEFDFVTIGDPGNPAWSSSVFDPPFEFGAVDYRFRMSRTEITSGQWLEFINIFAPQSDSPGTFLLPGVSGLRASGPAGTYVLDPFKPNAARLPVMGISWRDAAMYVNWLNNGKSSDWKAILTGAYDVSTFTQNPDGTFNDQPTRDPGARFWIPSLDEWTKAAHWDPDKYGEGQGGWWEYAGSSDTPLLPGVPGVGQTSAGAPFSDEWFNIVLGAFPDVKSPWGLLDTSGGASEWTEGGFLSRTRIAAGTNAGPDTELELDSINFPGLFTIPFPGGGFTGLRVASAIPVPGPIFALILIPAIFAQRTRR